MMALDLSSVVMLFVALGVALGLIFGATAFAIWLRTKIVWTPLGRFLHRLGLPNANGTISDLRKGQRYLVTQSFVDHHGGHFRPGESLTFVKADYLPYHGGHTLHFEERMLYLQEEENASVLGKIWSYIEPARR